MNKEAREFVIKEERRSYTLSNFTNNPYFNTNINDALQEDLEDMDPINDIKLDKQSIWTLEQKLAGVLKRSLEIYKNNILDQNPFEKMKVLKYSETLRDSIFELMTIGVGIRDKDWKLGSKRQFEQWDTYVDQNIALKLDPSQLSTKENDVYLTDEMSSNLWYIYFYSYNLNIGR